MLPQPAESALMNNQKQLLRRQSTSGQLEDSSPFASDVSWRLAVHEAQNKVLELIATRTSLTEVLSILAQKIEALASGAKCSILLLNDSGTHLHLGAAPSFPESYQAMLREGIPVGPCHGTCGTAIYRAEAVGTFDVNTDPKWDTCREIILAYGFRAYWSSPILNSTGRPIATFGMVYSYPCHPTTRDQHLIELSTHLAGIAIERRKSDDQLRALNTCLEQQVRERTAELEQALAFESTLKCITDKVRDSLDESHILKTTVKELAQVLKVECCDAGIYNSEHTTSTISYEYTTTVQSAQGRVVKISDYPDIYQQLLQGHQLQFNLLRSSSTRVKSKCFTILACPIVDDSGVLGDLWLFKPREQTFNQQEIHLVQQVANQCAIALRQSRLYQAAQTQMKEFERLNKLKDDFLSTVSHELRTPITNMKMAITMLGMNFVETDKTKRYLDILHRECRRESDLINDLLDLQRLDSPINDLELGEQVDVRSYLATLSDSFQNRIQEHQQTLELKIPNSLLTLQTSRTGFDRVLSELLNNACKYTSIGGRIQIEAVYTKTNVKIVVRNQADIPKTELARIFTKFYRIPHADPWKQGGTGLGLALVQKLVERLKGTIQVESNAGWTAFTVQFPRTSS